VDRHACKGAVLLAIIEEIWIRQIAERDLATLPRIGARKRHQLVRLRERERLEQNRVYNGENGGVRTNAEGQRDDGNDGEARIFEQLAEPVTDVV
jgi:hypothetical protein